ncbi:MAG: hypothetical protein VST69_07940 [Nitrospirota bacterium]|nr:hypothetical protein [Nitrospirota bacterium]
MPEPCKPKSCCYDQVKFKSFVCPTDGKKGQSVDVETLQHLIKPERRSEIKNAGYFFAKHMTATLFIIIPQVINVLIKAT